MKLIWDAAIKLPLWLSQCFQKCRNVTFNCKNLTLNSLWNRTRLFSEKLACKKKKKLSSHFRIINYVNVHKYIGASIDILAHTHIHKTTFI